MKCTLNSIDKIVCGLFAMALFFSAERVFAGIDSDWESEFTGPETFWGMETNGIKVALVIKPLTSFNVPIHCTPVIKSSIYATNRLNSINLYFPPPESCFQMTLKDGSGNIIPKTAKGKLLGKPITEPLMVKFGMNIQAGYKMRPIKQSHSELLSDFSFVLQDYFEATNSGKYQLTYEMRVILPQKNKDYARTIYTRDFPVLTLPPVIAQIEITNKSDSAKR